MAVKMFMLSESGREVSCSPFTFFSVSLAALEGPLAGAFCQRLREPRSHGVAGMRRPVQHLWAAGQLPAGFGENAHAGSRWVFGERRVHSCAF